MKLLNRKWGYRIGTAVLGMLLAIQLVPYGRDHANPPVTGEPAWDSPETRALARQACFDCHSNETQWPAYASIAPASWLVQHDVNDGRALLNFSEWTRPQEEAKEASAADVAVETGSPDALLALLTSTMTAEVRQRFETVLRAKAAATTGDIAAGRRFVAAYVPFIHHVERLFEAAVTPAHGTSDH